MAHTKQTIEAVKLGECKGIDRWDCGAFNRELLVLGNAEDEILAVECSTYDGRGTLATI